MGFFDFLKGENTTQQEENTPVGQAPLSVSVSFTPIRLSAHKESMVQAVLKVTNNTQEKQLVSLDMFAPKEHMIGFDTTCLSKKTEKKLETMEPRQTKEIAVKIYSSNQTKPGTYSLGIIGYVHYQTYDKVLSNVKKKVSLRVA